MREWLRMFFLFWLPPKFPERRFSMKISDLEDVPPGQVMVLTDVHTKRQWCVMHQDDFEHLIGTGNKFRLREPSETVEAESK